MNTIFIFTIIAVVIAIFFSTSCNHQSRDLQEFKFDPTVFDTTTDDVAKMSQLSYDRESIDEANRTKKNQPDQMYYAKFGHREVFLSSSSNRIPDPEYARHFASDKAKFFLTELDKLIFPDDIIWHQAYRQAVACGGQCLYNQLLMLEKLQSTSMSNAERNELARTLALRIVDNVELFLSQTFDDLQQAYIAKDWNYPHFDRHHDMTLRAIEYGIDLYLNKSLAYPKINKGFEHSELASSISIDNPQFNKVIKKIIQTSNSASDVEKYLSLIDDKLSQEASSFYGPLQTMKKNSVSQIMVAYKFKLVAHLIKEKRQ